MASSIQGVPRRTSPDDRQHTFTTLGETSFDLLVIGGGVTGAGVARDAALRGLRTALVERDDWAAGTSSRSSRLVHGGVRYLEHGHLGLVFEASRERRILLRTAPHLVRPLRFTWPIYRGARVPRWKVEAGLALYDALALFRNVGTHRPLSRAGVLAHEPALSGEGLRGGATYYDAATDDARLTLATVLAARDAGATVLNHSAVERLTFVEGGIRATVRDTLGGEIADVRARVAVNAAGPWSDAVRALAHGAGASRPSVLGAKGVHVAVPAERLGNCGAVTLVSPLDGRVMFALPAGPHAIIGTTETVAEQGPDETRATEQDVDYLLRSANAFFRDARLTRDDVVAAWSGIRPLAASEARGASTASVSREHAIERDARGLVTVTGGKLTTYRAMAAQVVDAAVALGGWRVGRARTDTLPLPGGDVPSLAALEAEVTAVVGAADVARRLTRAYGAEWRRVWRYVGRDASLTARVVDGLPYVAAELLHAVEHEQVCTLADLLVRRMPVAYEARDAGRSAARRWAPVIAESLGWDDAAVARALGTYDREAARLFAIDPA